MALTITVSKKDVIGTQRAVYGEVAFDASYPTGGETLDLVDLTDNFFIDALHDDARWLWNLESDSFWRIDEHRV